MSRNSKAFTATQFIAFTQDGVKRPTMGVLDRLRNSNGGIINSPPIWATFTLSACFYQISQRNPSHSVARPAAPLRLPAAGRADGYVIFNGGDPGRSPGGVHRLIMLGPRVGRAM